MKYYIDFINMHTSHQKTLGPYERAIQLTYLDIREAEKGETIATWDTLCECWCIIGDPPCDVYSDAIVYAKVIDDHSVNVSA